MNEETAGLTVVVPILNQMGFDATELTFESQFAIQLGRGVYTVKQDEVVRAQGRSDILCTRYGRPFLIVELKAPGEMLEEADRRQALSYARLVEPMAPFALLTNTRDTLLYDTITGELVERGVGGTAADEYQPAIASEIELRYQALQEFVGYSFENLLCFCSAHNQKVLELLGPAAGEPIESRLRKKYLPDAYVQRAHIEAALQTFVSSTERGIFPIIGDSGVGKTNLACHLVRSLASEPVLFYSGTYVHASLTQYIAETFNLVFSPQESGLSVLKKVTMLASRHGRKPLFVLDALDEWTASDKVAQLDQLADWMYTLGLKLVVTCKSQVWPEFISRNGLPSFVSQYLYAQAPQLSEFGDEELVEAERVYARVFGVALELRTRRPASLNPFAMRVAFEVSRATGASLDLSSFSRSMLARYLEMRLPSTAGVSQPQRFVPAVASSMFERDRPQIAEEEARTDLQIPFDAELPEQPFRQDILYRYVDEVGRGHVGFYFSMVRDHLIATHVLRLQEFSTALPTEQWDTILSRRLGESAVRYFFRTGTALEQQASIEAIAAYDERTGGTVLPRLLAWQGNDADPQVTTACSLIVARALRRHMDGNTRDTILAEQVVQSSAVLPRSIQEGFLADYFGLLLHRRGPVEMVSENIADILGKGSEQEVTARLVEMAKDQTGDGYVRRYVIAALRKRAGFDKRRLFLTLIIDPEINVRNYVSSWYRDLEDEVLRDEVMAVLDAQTDRNIKIDIVTLLGHSRCTGTAELLHQRLVAQRWQGSLQQWAWRALAWLKHDPLVPLLLGQLRKDPSSELGGQALIAIGEMRAKEAMDGLLDLVRTGYGSIGNSKTWLPHAFHDIADSEDYEALARIAQEVPAAGADDLAMLLLAGTQDRRWDAVVLNHISCQYDSPLRHSIFEAWTRSITSERVSGGTYRERLDNVVLAPEIRESLYALLNAKDSLSPVAMSVLVIVERDQDRLLHEMQRNLPMMEMRFSSRNIPGVWHLRSREFRRVLRPWLHRIIATTSTSPVVAENCFELLKVVADDSTLDFISAHRVRFETVVGTVDLAELEHRIRQGRVS